MTAPEFSMSIAAIGWAVAIGFCLILVLQT